MYDPFRCEYADYNPLSERLQLRCTLAVELRRLRRVNNESGRPFDHDTLRQVAVQNLRHRGMRVRDTSKLDVSHARTWARDLWDASEAGIPRGLPCGADDAYGERLDHMRSQALAIWRLVGRF